MRNIRLSKSCIGKEEIDAVTDVLHREYLGMGQDVHKFEDDLKDFFGRDVTLVNNWYGSFASCSTRCRNKRWR